MAIRVGVVLSGCGYLDGAEITEAVSVLIALDRRGAVVTCMAPDIPQSSTVNHHTKKAESPARSVLVESARIARGKIVDIAHVKADDLDALIFPGGFGAAKNLSDFAHKGEHCTVNEYVRRLITEIHNARKPLGFACIAPVLAARVLGNLHPKLTIGTDVDTAKAMGAMGAVHQDTAPADICTDIDHRIVTTPCYMNDVGPWTVYQGAEKMVEEVLRLAGDTASLIREQLGTIRPEPVHHEH